MRVVTEHQGGSCLCGKPVELKIIGGADSPLTENGFLPVYKCKDCHVKYERGAKTL